MDLYAKPIITTQDDGTISIKVLPITPEYIDTRLAELDVFGQINYNIKEVADAVQNTDSQKQAAKRLKTLLDIGPEEADFLLDLTIEEMAYYFDRDNCEKEIVKWNNLKALLVQ